MKALQTLHRLLVGDCDARRVGVRSLIEKQESPLFGKLAYSQKPFMMEATTSTATQAVLLHNVALAAAASQNAAPSVVSLADPLLLSHWYHLQFQRLQSEQYSLGISNYLAHGKFSKANQERKR